MSHLDEGTIHAWLDGALPPDEATRVATHMRECAECAAMLAEARGFIAGASRIVSSLDVVRGNVLPPAAGVVRTGVPETSIWRMLKLSPARAALAATILVGVASMFTLRRQNQGPVDSAARTVEAPAVAPAAGAASTPPPSQVPVQRVTRAPAPTVDRAPTQAVTQVPAPAPTQAPTKALVGSARARQTADEVTSTAAASAPSVAEARKAAASADVGKRAVTNAAGAVAQFRSMAAAPAANVEGCYRLQAALASGLRGFPEQFRLARDTSSGANTVHLTTVDGRDSILTDATWRVLASDEVVVTVPDDGTEATRLSFVLSRGEATVSSRGVSSVVKVERNSCQR